MRAIDMHAHVPRKPGLPALGTEAQMRSYFKVTSAPEDAGEMAARYRELDLMAVIFSVDAETSTGDPPDTNDYVAAIAKQDPEVFTGFATVDPWKGKAAVEELERSVTELGLVGLKLHPVRQAFFPNDTQFYPLYEKATEMQVPVLFHSGYAGVGSGSPGGAGFKLKYAAPIPSIDDVAADFPQLTIIMAHPGWPWTEEQIAVSLHKTNVFLDLSGWAPPYIPEPLIKEVNTRLQDKVLFGSDYPYIQPDRWFREFEALAIRDEVRPKVLLDNARRLLKLA